MDTTGIMHELRLGTKTVRRFMRAVTVEEILTRGPSGRIGMLDARTDYLARRWDEGCTGAYTLHAELVARGVHVSKRTVRRVVQRMRENTAPPHPCPWRPRHGSERAYPHPPRRSARDEQALCKELTTRCADLTVLRALVQGVRGLLVNRQGDEELDGWLNSEKNSDIPELRGFADSLSRDCDAVRAGLTLPSSSGVVQGHVNQIKILKRQMLGRAGHRLLRHRIRALTPDVGHTRHWVLRI
ncbi:hypothetical protein ACWGBO_15010 [[Kitasatospora] papulosa]